MGNSPSRISPEGVTRYGDNRLRTFEPDRVRNSSPFRAKRLFRLTQGKPWAKLSCPFGEGPWGRIIGDKYMRASMLRLLPRDLPGKEDTISARDTRQRGSA